MAAITMTSARLAAIIRRDLITLASYHLQLFLSFSETWVAAVSFYFVGEFVGQPGVIADLDGGYFEFVLVGTIVSGCVQMAMRTFSMSMSEEIEDGTLETVLASPGSLQVLLAGSSVVPMLTLFVQLTVLLCVGLVIGGVGIPFVALVQALPLLVMTTLSFAAVGMASSGVLILAKRGDPISGPLGRVILLFSGVLYPVSVLPGWLQTISYLLPSTHAIEGMRSLVLGDASFVDTLDELAFVTVSTVVLLPVGYVVLSRCITEARRAGTLANY